jgi:hypothetical protein
MCGDCRWGDWTQPAFKCPTKNYFRVSDRQFAYVFQRQKADSLLVFGYGLLVPVLVVE